MRKFLLALVAVLAIPVFAHAEPTDGSPPAKKGMLGADGAIVLPLGDWSDLAGLGLGATLHYEHPFDQNWSFTGRVGYIHHLSKETGPYSYTTSEIPFMVGAKYHLGAAAPGLYFAGELGLTIFRFDLEYDGPENPFVDEVDHSDSETDLGMTLGAGYSMGNFDLAARLYAPDFDVAGLMATVGYHFTSL